MMLFSEEFAEEGFFLFGGGDGGSAAGEAAVDLGPGGERAEVAVVDVEVGGHFATALSGGRFRRQFLGVVGVDGEKRQTALGAPVDRLAKELPFAHGPQDQPQIRLLLLELAQRRHRERQFLADLRVAVLHDRPVKIYCYNHLCYFYRCAGQRAKVPKR